MVDLVIGLIGLAIFGLIDLAIWVFALRSWLRRRIFLLRAVRVEGECIRVRTSRAGSSGSGHEVYHPVVRFEDEAGRSHTVQCTRGGEMWDDMVGTPLDVLMLPGRPRTALVELDKHNTPTVLFFLALGFFVPVLMFLLPTLGALRDLD